MRLLFGKLVAVMGSVTITRANIASQAVAGVSVCQGDVIETGSDGFVILSFGDGSAFHLYSNTHTALDEFTL